MKKWRVVSGDMDWSGEAPGWQEAFRKAVGWVQPMSLGALTSLQEDGGIPAYCDTVEQLLQMGILGE
jgi:hypothetical protein